MIYECEAGWHPMIEELLTKLKPYPIKILQIKEKFGGLRVYYQWTGPSSIPMIAGVNGLIEEAEIKCAKICEVTGEPGVLHTKDGWFKTLSEDKAKELGYIPYKRFMR